MLESIFNILVINTIYTIYNNTISIIGKHNRKMFTAKFYNQQNHDQKEVYQEPARQVCEEVVDQQFHSPLPRRPSVRKWVSDPPYHQEYSVHSTGQLEEQQPTRVHHERLPR